MRIDTLEASGAPPPADDRAGWQRRWMRRSAVALALVLAAATTVAVANRDVVGATLTHRVGGPEQTWKVINLPPASQPGLRVALAGDVGDGGERAFETAATVIKQSRYDRYDILMLLGDNVYPFGDPARISATVFGPFGPLIDTGTELFAVLGNHDELRGTGAAQLEALGMPGRWYAVERGNMLGIALDSTMPDDPIQLDWLEKTLAASDATWKLVGFHHPPYSSGYHGSDEEVRAAFVPLFERYGVQIVFSGHEHDYQRSDPINGIVYIVSGAASRARRTGIADFTAVAYSTHHYVDLNIYDDHILLRAIDQDGEQFDEVVIPAETPPAVPSPAQPPNTLANVGPVDLTQG